MTGPRGLFVPLFFSIFSSILNLYPCDRILVLSACEGNCFEVVSILVKGIAVDLERTGLEVIAEGTGKMNAPREAILDRLERDEVRFCLQCRFRGDEREIDVGFELIDRAAEGAIGRASARLEVSMDADEAVLGALRELVRSTRLAEMADKPESPPKIIVAPAEVYIAQAARTEVPVLAFEAPETAETAWAPPPEIAGVPELAAAALMPEPSAKARFDIHVRGAPFIVLGPAAQYLSLGADLSAFFGGVIAEAPWKLVLGAACGASRLFARGTGEDYQIYQSRFGLESRGSIPLNEKLSLTASADFGLSILLAVAPDGDVVNKALSYASCGCGCGFAFSERFSMAMDVGFRCVFEQRYPIFGLLPGLSVTWKL